MWPKIVNFELILIYFLLLIPWPHTHVIKLLCSKDNSRLVRKIVRSKWTPILDKYQVKLPLECPLHPFRDLFAPRQDAKKRDRPTQWTCRKCGKSFYKEKFLDLHFETRHKSILNKDEDAVCLADFCDIMRCEVFQSEESSSLRVGDSHIVTDIEVWGDSLGQNSALAKANAAYLSLIPLRTSASGASRASKVQQNRQLCQDKIGQNKHKETTRDTNDDKKEHVERPKTNNDAIKKRTFTPGQSHSSSSSASFAAAHSKNAAKSDKSKNAKSSAANQSDELESANEKNNETNSNTSNTSSTSNAESNENSTQNGNAQNMQKVRANCRAEDLSKLKSKCEYLVRSCIAGLLLSMTDHAFKEMEEEMNKAVCWYLSCDRYWEDGPLEPRAFPWGLIVILVFVLSTGICFCYYIIWILFDSEESTINANHQQHYMHHQQQYQHQQHYQQHGGMHSAAQQQQHYYYQQQQQQQQNLAYQQEIYDRRDFPNRATTANIPTTVVGGSSSINLAGSHNHPVEETAASMAASDGGTRHYNPNHHHSSLDAHHRHVGSSQTSLRGSASAHEIIQSEIGHNEHYIYVTYPPDLKKRFFEKYE